MRIVTLVYAFLLVKLYHCEGRTLGVAPEDEPSDGVVNGNEQSVEFLEMHDISSTGNIQEPQNDQNIIASSSPVIDISEPNRDVCFTFDIIPNTAKLIIQRLNINSKRLVNCSEEIYHVKPGEDLHYTKAISRHGEYVLVFISIKELNKFKHIYFERDGNGDWWEIDKEGFEEKLLDIGLIPPDISIFSLGSSEQDEQDILCDLGIEESVDMTLSDEDYDEYEPIH